MKITAKTNETSVIAKETTISGDLDFVGTLIVEGKLESQVKGTDLTIQQSGKFNGTIHVRSINCHGEIEGDLHAETVVIHSSARVSGTINTSNLEIEPGATINGKIKMQPQKTASVQPLNDKIAKSNG